MNDVACRARSVPELQKKLMSMFADFESTGEPYRPLPSDIIISPYSKCGTTWLQQIFHTLRTRGDMDFRDISEVVPWIETSPRLGIDLNAPQRAEPRGFKSHLAQDEVPAGARYIVSIRDPRDALVSLYKFMEGWFLEPGAVDIDEFARENYLRGPHRRYWHHLASWWEHRHDDNVLLLSYEGMKKDTGGTIHRVADFAGIPLDDELMEITLKHSSLDFMLEHKDRFDDFLMRGLSERTANLPPNSDSAKVREGEVGSHVSVLGDDVLAEMDEIWRTDIQPLFGFTCYNEMEQALQAELTVSRS
ncbi:MAG: sulfotransferase domain-containing protein [Pseudomonadales bacterium]|nr:sulfotransferase domain-containing protein [Pseudomonadales bacterium]